MNKNTNSQATTMSNKECSGELSTKDEMKSDKDLYEGDDVITYWPWDSNDVTIKDEEYDGGICKCGRILRFKRPKIKAWHPIKCLCCGYIINVFCGEEGELLSMAQIRAITPINGRLGD